MVEIIEKVRAQLLAGSDEETRIKGERFFRETVKLYGLKSGDVEKIANDTFATLPDKDKSFVFSLCEQLWKSGYSEEAFIACNWAYKVRKQYAVSDFAIFDYWVNTYVSNWATCDTLCNHSVGTLVESFPALLTELKTWALSSNRWVKRASAVTLIIPARKGLFPDDIFAIAGILHSDSDDMVQKGYGWMLKAASQAHQQKVFDYVMAWKKTMPRTALRYAIEKMPAEMKKQAMSK